MSAQNFLVSPGGPITLDSGAPAAPGDQVKVDPENVKDARLIRDGRLIEIKPKPKARSKAKES